MKNEFDEALYLVDGSYYFHLEEVKEGFRYAAYDAETKQFLASDLIRNEDILESPIRNPIAAARILAFEDYGAYGLTVQSVALKTLERIPEAKRAYRRKHGHDSHDHSIRFINSSYDELFRIDNGTCIQMTYPDGDLIRKCEYVDDYHTRVGGELYHICQFAELTEQNNCLVQPEHEILADTSGWEIQGKGYLAIQECDSGWDYTVCDLDFHEIDGGQIDEPELSMLAVRDEILTELQWDRRPMLHADCDSILDRIQEVQEKSVLAQLKTYKAEADAMPETSHPKKGQER